MAAQKNSVEAVDNRNMKRLKDEEQVRQRPGVIFGTNTEEGAMVSVFEVIANSIDEAREGYGKKINITVEEDNVVTVEDEGRGLPMDWNEDEGMYNWELALCTLYASGKYDNTQYSQSVGLNGLGLTSTQYASSFMEVWSTYDGKTRYMSFRVGRPIGKMQVGKAIKEGTGTKIRFRPDPNVFIGLRTKKLTAEMFLFDLRRQAMLVDGLEIILKHYDLENPVRLCYENGITQYIDSLVDKMMMPKTLMFTDVEEGTDDPELYPEKYKVNMRIAFNFTRDQETHGIIEVYHNNSYLFEGGVTVSGFERGITGAFTDYAKATGKISKADRFQYKDIADILLCVLATDAPGNRTFFKNQTKGAITNQFIGTAVTQFVYNKFRYWMEHSENKAVVDKIVAEVVLNKKAREEGQEVSKKVINSLSKAVGFGSSLKHFKDCSSKNKLERELYIVEGLSALGSVKLACDAKYQAVLAIRGKIINCLKEKTTRILNSDVIIEMYRVLGCGLEVKSKYTEDLPKFDINKLNWGKVIICTDADVDGGHIITLLITAFYVLSPSLLKARKVYIAQTPLYEISYKDDVRFAYSDEERDKVLDKIEDQYAINRSRIKVQRSKGLGENDSEMMAQFAMQPTTRRLIPVEYNETSENLRDLFDALLGDDIESRRLLIDQYFSMIDDNLD